MHLKCRSAVKTATLTALVGFCATKKNAIKYSAGQKKIFIEFNFDLKWILSSRSTFKYIELFDVKQAVSMRNLLEVEGFR